MSRRRIFDTGGAPPEEIEGVRRALQRHGIDYYETRPGIWGLVPGSLWVESQAEYQHAREVIDQFQTEWVARARSQPVSRGINWPAVPALLMVAAAVAWMTYKIFTLGAPSP